MLCYVTDRCALASAAAPDQEAVLLDSIRAAIAAGVDWVQLREKDLDARPLFQLAAKAIADSGARSRILINDRLDVAAAAGAGGIHLGEASLPLSAVAKWKRSGGRNHFLIGVSCHSPEAALAAAHDGADYIFFGPVYPTPSKAAFGPPQGLARLAQAASAVPIPVLAIGGITASNAARCFAAGAAGIAAIRLFQQAPDLQRLVSALR